MMGTSGCDGDTTVKGRPYVGPKTKWMFVVEVSMLASHAVLCELTGRFAMGVFQTLSAGNIGQLGAPGTGVPGDATPGATPIVRPSEITAAATNAAAALLLRRLTGVPPVSTVLHPWQCP